MRTENAEGRRPNAERRPRAFAVNYKWTEADSVVCSGHTVVFGRDRAEAERRFFNLNRHVRLEVAA